MMLTSYKSPKKQKKKKSMAPKLHRNCNASLWWLSNPTVKSQRHRKFRSEAAMEAIEKARDDKSRNLVLYNYPSFSGAFSALFAHLYHSLSGLPSLTLPFSSHVPFRVEDFFCMEGLERCYLLDFLGPKGFAAGISKQMNCEVIAFDHRKSALSRMPSVDDCQGKMIFRVDPEKSSSRATYEYFSNELVNLKSPDVEAARLLSPEDKEDVEKILNYIEDADLRQWSLPDNRAFKIGLKELRSQINCITNPYMFEQLLRIRAADLIAKGSTYIFSRQTAATKLLDKVFKVRLGRGFYGECLGVRADGNPDLSDEVGKELSVKSAAAGLRPIGAVIYLQRKNLKMCLRSTDKATDTSEVAKAYGGGGLPGSSSFIIRMDEYNNWLSGDAS